MSDPAEFRARAVVEAVRYQPHLNCADVPETEAGEPTTPASAPTMTGEVVDLPLKSIIAGPQVREKWHNRDNVEALRLVVDATPPIQVRDLGDGTYECLSGEHRRQAATEEGRETIRALLVELPDDESAFLFAVKANNEHGLSYTPSERRDLARRLIRQKVHSNRTIASAAGIRPETVADMVKEFEEANTPKVQAPRPTASRESVGQPAKSKGKDNKDRPKSAEDRKAQFARVVAAIEAAPGRSDREIAAEIGCSPTTVGGARDHLSRTAATGRPLASVKPAPVATVKPAEPTVADLLPVWPSAGQWASDTRFKVTEMAHALAKFMDRRSIRPADGTTEAIAAAVPVDARKTVADAAKSQAAQWSEIARLLENPTQMMEAKRR